MSKAIELAKECGIRVSWEAYGQPHNITNQLEAYYAACAAEKDKELAELKSRLAAMERQEPVADVIVSHNDGSFGNKIAPRKWATYQNELASLQSEPWVKNGIASIVPLYAAPTTAMLDNARDEENEACAKLCDEYANNSSNPMNFAENCAKAIRARRMK